MDPPPIFRLVLALFFVSLQALKAPPAFVVALRPSVLPHFADRQTLEESRVAAARSKLRAKARSRFLQRREDALMGFEVSRRAMVET